VCAPARGRRRGGTRRSSPRSSPARPCRAPAPRRHHATTLSCVRGEGRRPRPGGASQCPGGRASHGNARAHRRRPRPVGDDAEVVAAPRLVDADAAPLLRRAGRRRHPHELAHHRRRDHRQQPRVGAPPPWGGPPLIVGPRRPAPPPRLRPAPAQPAPRGGGRAPGRRPRGHAPACDGLTRCAQAAASAGGWWCVVVWGEDVGAAEPTGDM
jgi:hypothetical protein